MFETGLMFETVLIPGAVKASLWFDPSNLRIDRSRLLATPRQVFHPTIGRIT